jgi:hypothetical protein
LFIRGNFNLLENIQEVSKLYQSKYDKIFIDTAMLAGSKTWTLLEVNLNNGTISEIDSPKDLNELQLSVLRFFYSNLEEDFSSMSKFQKKKILEKFQSTKELLSISNLKKA